MPHFLGVWFDHVLQTHEDVLEFNKKMSGAPASLAPVASDDPVLEVEATEVAVDPVLPPPAPVPAISPPVPVPSAPAPAPTPVPPAPAPAVTEDDHHFDPEHDV